MSKRRRLIVANWKMYGRLTSGLVLARDIAAFAETARPLSFDLVLCPPATLTWAIGETLQGTQVMLGGQDCHTATHGAYTGDISAAMLVDLGCRYVILGHSERRHGHGESNELIAKKVEAAQVAGLTTIVCVGETAEDLKAGATAEIIGKQVRESLPKNIRTSDLVIAYEPVWAIGTGQQPEPKDIVAVNRHIRNALGDIGETVRLLYGGSVTPSNAGGILAEDEIDGLLVGSASLNADGFWAITEPCRI
ncbi:MAG: triose-phosphate isomerase [Alphaproteobacteria bacterium]|nr:triose-phosphate isomerase [Alphaproteobacteria bacterium]